MINCQNTYWNTTRWQHVLFLKMIPKTTSVDNLLQRTWSVFTSRWQTVKHTNWSWKLYSLTNYFNEADVQNNARWRIPLNNWFIKHRSPNTCLGKLIYETHIVYVSFTGNGTQLSGLPHHRIQLSCIELRHIGNYHVRKLMSPVEFI